MSQYRNPVVAALIAAAAAAGLVGVPGSASAPRATNQTAPAKNKREHRRLMAGTARLFREQRKGPGWTHAQVQRMAKKRRNALRNRKAHR